jgi:transposase
MKEFVLDTPAPEPMSAAQRNAIYWRLWKAAEEAQPGANRFAITTRVLGRVKKIEELAEEEFLKLMRAFEKIAQQGAPRVKAAKQHDDVPDSAVVGRGDRRERQSPLSEFQATERNRREGIVLQLLTLINREVNPLSQNHAAKILGESAAVLSRWRRAYEEKGRDGLIPQQAAKCGAKAKFELDEDEQNALRHCRLRKDSLPLAIEDFISEPECRPETRELIVAELERAARERRLPSWPMSLQRAGYVSDEMRAAFRGKKHARQFEIIERRGMWLLDPENGVEIPMGPNTLRESDDMSSNKPHRYVDPQTGNLDVGRQNLATVDVYSNAFLGVSPIGRDRDAYRLEDIADHLRDIVLAHGLPQIWRFERGAWENQVIDGIRLKPQIRPPDWDEKKRWGGLDALFRVQHVFTSGAKGTIESSFDLLQSLMDHHPERDGACIGRRRGEFEHATRLLRDATDAKASVEKRARAAMHFWDIAAAADGIQAAMQRFNARPKVRRAFGKQPVVPNDLFAGATKRECPVDELWRFLPIKDSATVRGGAIEKSIDHYPFPFRFRVNGVSDLYLEHGYSVLIAFHPGRPEDGCHVFNAERGARNREGLKFGEGMFVAPLAEDAPQLNLRPEEYEFVRRKNANAAVRSEFRAIVGAGRTGRRISTARDGYGNSARTENLPSSAGRGSRGCPASPSPAPVLARGFGHESPAAAATPFDEEAELARIQRLERDAIERGDILVT